MSGKIGFWRWLLLKIWKGIKTIPKLPKLVKDADPAFETVLGLIGMVAIAPILAVYLAFPAGLLAWLAFMLLVTHSIYRMEMEEDC